MNDRRSYQKSETRRENRNVPDFPDLLPTIQDSRVSMISSFHFTENLALLGKSEIAGRLGFSLHMKTRHCYRSRRYCNQRPTWR